MWIIIKENAANFALMRLKRKEQNVKAGTKQTKEMREKEQATKANEVRAGKEEEKKNNCIVISRTQIAYQCAVRTCNGQNNAETSGLFDQNADLVFVYCCCYCRYIGVTHKTRTKTICRRGGGR